MSTHFGGGANDGTNARDRDEQSTDAGCQAGELRGLIERIALQLSDTDQRQSAALEQMLAKVEALGAEARSYKSRVPQDFLPAFERIQDGVAQLAERIAGAHGVRDDAWPPASAQPAVPQPVAEAVAAVAASGMAMPNDDADAHLAAHLTTNVATTAPAMEPEADVSAHLPRNQVEAQQPASVIDPVMANDETAWDEAAAEALAAHYEQELGTLAPVEAPIEADHAGGMTAGDGEAPVMLASAFADSTAAPPQDVRASLIESDRDWLEDRFVEIARKVEDAFAQQGTDSILESLDQRLAQFEQRFGSALNDVAMRQDIEPLHILEAQIADLAQQFEETSGQLGRLDKIEHSLAAVIDRLTDPRFDDALERTVTDDRDLEPLISAAVEQISQRLNSAQPAMPDLQGLAEGIADAAAERVASRFAEMGPAASGSETSSVDMDAIRQMLDGFISERREGEEQTAAMLDTMQRALIRVLDRVDALEVSQSKSGSGDYGRFGGEPAGPRPVEPAAMPRVAPAHVANHAASDDYEFDEGATAARPFVETGTQTDGPAVRRQPSSPASIERLRQDFIADARRAKERAASAAPAAAEIPGMRTSAAPAPASQASEGVKLGKPRAVTTPADTEGDAGASIVSRMRKPSRKLVVTAIVLMIAIPGVMMLMKKNRAAAPTPTAIEQSQPSGNRAIVPIKPARQTSDESAAPADETPSTAKPEMGDAQPSGADSKPSKPLSADDLPVRQKSAAPETRGELEQTSAPSEAPVAPVTAPAASRAGNKDALFRTNPKSHSTDLGQSVEVPVEAEVPGGSAFPVVPMSNRVPPSGITVAHPRRAPTLGQLERLGERQTMAQLSSQLGDAQVNAVPATLIPEFMYGKDGQAPAATPVARELPPPAASAVAGHSRPLDLPPAMVGPLSLRLAAAKGDPSAEFAVAARFADGNGIKQDLGEAMRWYQRSASRGFAQAQYRVATFYERGLGVTQDNARAKIWYQRAAESGNVKAMHNLAVLSAGRAAKVPDYPTAARWFKAAAEHGLADSQFNLAVLHESGLGVERDDAQAHFWFAMAARSGDKEAKRRQDELEKAMTPEQLAEANRAIAAWHPKQADRIANDPLSASEAWKAQASAQGAI